MMYDRILDAIGGGGLGIVGWLSEAYELKK